MNRISHSIKGDFLPESENKNSKKKKEATGGQIVKKTGV